MRRTPLILADIGILLLLGLTPLLPSLVPAAEPSVHRDVDRVGVYQHLGTREFAADRPLRQLAQTMSL